MTIAKTIKRHVVLGALVLSSIYLRAQDDPVIMTINGEDVPRSEFEYSYNKNNSEGVIDKKTIEEYVDLFINYKLKVVAAMEAQLDTLSSFKKEFARYRNQQVKPVLATDADVEREAKQFYNEWCSQVGARGLAHACHILLRISQTATEAEQAAVKERIDSVYNALLAGADFEELAKRVSQDEDSAPRGGLLPWMATGQTVKEFEDQAFALQPGEMSRPFLTPSGYHIILMKERKQPDPYEDMKEDIIDFLEKRNIRAKIVNEKVGERVRQSDGRLTKDEVMAALADSLSQTDSATKYLIQEYHDGLLLFEISNRAVWAKAAQDEEGLERYYKRNKKKYGWSGKRFRGIAYHVKVQEDADSIKDCVKDLPFNEWGPALGKRFNSGEELRIRVEKGIFKEGDNALVDKEIFGKDTTVAHMDGYPIDGTYGKLLKKGPEDYNDVRGLVIADYQEEKEKEWVESLRQKYDVEIREDVLATVNNH